MLVEMRDEIFSIFEESSLIQKPNKGSKDLEWELVVTQDIDDGKFINKVPNKSLGIEFHDVLESLALSKALSGHLDKIVPNEQSLQISFLMELSEKINKYS